jgi:hypothetical protein
MSLDFHTLDPTSPAHSYTVQPNYPRISVSYDKVHLTEIPFNGSEVKLADDVGESRRHRRRVQVTSYKLILTPAPKSVAPRQKFQRPSLYTG